MNYIKSNNSNNSDNIIEKEIYDENKNDGGKDNYLLIEINFPDYPADEKRQYIGKLMKY